MKIIDKRMALVEVSQFSKGQSSGQDKLIGLFELPYTEEEKEWSQKIDYTSAISKLCIVGTITFAGVNYVVKVNDKIYESIPNDKHAEFSIYLHGDVVLPKIVEKQITTSCKITLCVFE